MSVQNVTVPYDAIINLIEEQFATVKARNTDFSSINFVVADEQSFVKIKDKNPKYLYIVVRFSPASINFGQATLPLEFVVAGVQNETRLTQAFLNAFVNAYNLKDENDVTQLYMTPRVSLNFNDVYNGFRSLFSVSGTWLIGDNTIRLSDLMFYVNGGIEGEEPEHIKVLTYNSTGEGSLNPQPYPDTKGRTKSYGSFETFAFSIVIYPDGSKKFVQKLFQYQFDFSKSHQNDDFAFRLKFNNMDLDFENPNEHTLRDITDLKNFKCKAIDYNFKIGDIPAINATFTL